jgi:hypothetical protein
VRTLLPTLTTTRWVDSKQIVLLSVIAFARYCGPMENLLLNPF